jgi:hypothetical protein
MNLKKRVTDLNRQPFVYLKKTHLRLLLGGVRKEKETILASVL